MVNSPEDHHHPCEGGDEGALIRCVYSMLIGDGCLKGYIDRMC